MDKAALTKATVFFGVSIVTLLIVPHFVTAEDIQRPILSTDRSPLSVVGLRLCSGIAPEHGIRGASQVLASHDLFRCQGDCDTEHTACWRKCLDGPIEENQACHKACNEEKFRCVWECTYHD